MRVKCLVQEHNAIAQTPETSALITSSLRLPISMHDVKMVRFGAVVKPWGKDGFKKILFPTDQDCFKQHQFKSLSKFKFEISVSFCRLMTDLMLI